jgi:hypothetical protein
LLALANHFTVNQFDRGKSGADEVSQSVEETVADQEQIAAEEAAEAEAQEALDGGRGSTSR